MQVFVDWCLSHCSQGQADVAYPSCQTAAVLAFGMTFYTFNSLIECLICYCKNDWVKATVDAADDLCDFVNGT